MIHFLFQDETGDGTKADFTHECGTCAGLFDSATDLYNHRAYHCAVSLRCSHCTGKKKCCREL